MSASDTAIAPAFDPQLEILLLPAPSEGERSVAAIQAKFCSCLTAIKEELVPNATTGELVRCSGFRQKKDFIQSGHVHMTAKDVFLGPDCSLQFLPEVTAWVGIPAYLAYITQTYFLCVQ
jgi:hypothetical protein